MKRKQKHTTITQPAVARRQLSVGGMCQDVPLARAPTARTLPNNGTNANWQQKDDLDKGKMAKKRKLRNKGVLNAP